jgi:hypothetical protein
VPEMVSIIKAQKYRIALETAQACCEILGGDGIDDEYFPMMTNGSECFLAIYS